MKANITRIDKGKNSDADTEVSMSMSKTPPMIKEKSEFVLTYHHCHIVGHIKPNCLKLRSLSTNKVRPPTRKFSSSKINHVISSYSLIRECQIGFILCLKAVYLFLVSN